MHQDFPAVCRLLCDEIDWTQPAMAASPMAVAYRDEDYCRAARLFIRYLRERPSPRWLFTPDFVRQVRAQATPSYREQAVKALGTLIVDGAEGGYGKVLCLPFLPAQDFHVAATPEFFQQLQQALLDQRAHWGEWGCQTIYRWFETVQAAWPMEECPDDFFIPALCWLLIEARHAWQFTQRWHEAMLGTSGHNWWAFELCALWKISLYFPECRGLAQFRALYPTYLEREVTLSLDADGYSEEQSVSYHWALADIVMSTARIAELNGLPLSPTLRHQLEECARLAYRLIAPDGTAPSFGDHGGGSILSRVRETAVEFRLPEAKYVADQLGAALSSPIAGMMVYPRTFGMIDADLAPEYQALPAHAPALDSALSRAGLYVMRSAWQPDAHYLCMEACPRGASATSHGHTTLMNFVLHSFGTPVLIDSGAGWETDESGVWWRTGSFSHNVATVDNEHHLPIRSIFRWDQVVTPRTERWESTPDYSYFSGVHEGYERLPRRVSATRRKIFAVRGGYWILIDRFTAASPVEPHTYTQHFQVNLPCRLNDDGRLLTAGEAGNLLMVPVTTDQLTPNLEPCPYPQDHYPNPDHLTYTLEKEGSGLLVTLLAPFFGKAQPTVTARFLPVLSADRELSPWEATGLEIIIDGRRDVYLDFHTHWHSAWTCGEYAGEGRLFHSRCLKS